MALREVPIRRFGGLQLSTDPQDVLLESATDLLNVEFPADRSRVLCRPGTARIGSSGALANIPQALLPVVFGSDAYMLAAGVTGGGDVFLDQMTSTGTYTAVGTWADAGSQATSVSMVQFGTPTTSRAFIARDGTTLHKYDGSSLTTSTGKPRFLEVSPLSNRLVQAGFAVAADSPSGADGSPSTVFFSDNGDPETYSADNFVDLHPGDGESIQGTAVYGGQLFVFKETSVFVFYGESKDAAGEPVFNYRQEQLPAGVFSPGTVGPRGAGVRVASGSRGVYFAADDGVYVTTGGRPAKISDPLESVFSSMTTANVPVLACVDERVFFFYDVADQFSAGNAAYVLDERNGQWSRWTLPNANAIWAAPVAWHQRFPFGRTVVFANNEDLFRLTDGLQGDSAGTLSFSSHYQSGYNDLGSNDKKVVRESAIWALAHTPAALTYSMATDYAAADAGASITVGNETVAEGRDRSARRGTSFAFRVAGASGQPYAWTVDEVVLYVRDSRAPGMTG